MADKSKKEMDQHQENSLNQNPGGRSPDRELGDKGGNNESSARNQKPSGQAPNSSGKSSQSLCPIMPQNYMTF